MNKLQPKNKICFQTKSYRANLFLNKYRNKKWNILRKKVRLESKELRPETKKKFFQQRLIEKQKFQHFYQIKYYQLKNLFNVFKKTKNKNAFKNFVSKLDSRLDVSLIRLKLAKSIYQAKQLITHNKIKVNKRIVNKNNILLKKGDFILRTYGSTNNKNTSYKTTKYRKEVLSKKKKRKKFFLEKLQRLFRKQEEDLLPPKQQNTKSKSFPKKKRQQWTKR
jgi:ribosomal protein S4